jgi:hypothetical protein
MTPEQAREMWATALKEAEEPGTIYDTVLYHVERSVLIDTINKRMQLSDDFAIAIGKRMQKLIDALSNAGQP